MATGCGGPQKNDLEVEKPPAEKNYIPIEGFLLSEISYVDSLPLGISKITRQNGHSDTTYTQAPEFDYLARQFFVKELDTNYFRENFNETSFYDQTTRNMTFTYSANNDTTPLRRLDVMVSPKGAYNVIRSIYMERISHQQDTAMTKKMYWQSKRRFQVVTTRQVGAAAPTMSELYIVWDNSE